MISDKTLKDLGFRKDKNYRKKTNGISSYSWFWAQMEVFTIEKHHCGAYGEGEDFYPTLRVHCMIVVIDNIEKLNNVIKLFGLTEKEFNALQEREQKQIDICL